MAKILLVEDDNNLREIYGARLTAEGYEIVSAPDGEEALALAVKEKPDLIITDVMMPKISGFDMLDILRNAPETKDTKVIMMTALSQAEDKERAEKLGADLYLVKSQVTLEDVAASVRKILGDDSPSDEKPAETPPATAAPEPATPVEAPSEAPVEPPKETGTQESSTPAPAPAATPVPVPEPAAAPTPAATPEPPSPAVASPAPPEPVIQPPQPAAVVDEPDKPAPKKIEVTLPESKDEAAATAAQTTTPAPEPAKEPEQSAAPVETSSIGPNLAEALADEEKSIQGQINDFEKAPADKDTSPPPPAPAPSPEPPAEPSAVSSTIIKPEAPVPPPDQADQPESATANDNNNPNRRVIQPINDPTKGPDLETLMAKEQAKEALATPDASTTIEPNPPSTSSSATGTDDFSKISL